MRLRRIRGKGRGRDRGKREGDGGGDKGGGEGIRRRGEEKRWKKVLWRGRGGEG